MKASVWIELRGQVDALALWRELEGYAMNVTDVIDKVWIYGDCSNEVAGRVIAICSKYGKLTAEIRGCAYEPKKEEGKA